MADCLFCRIISKELPAAIVYEDDHVIGFLDIKPVNPGHTLVVPKKHSEGFHDADAGSLQELIIATQRIARGLIAAGICEAFNLEENNGAIAGQVIPHLHLHIVPRRVDDGLKHWPGTPYAEGEMDRVAASIRAQIGV